MVTLDPIIYDQNSPVYFAVCRIGPPLATSFRWRCVPVWRRDEMQVQS